MALPYSKYQGEGGGPTGTTAHSVYIVLYFFLEFFERKKPVKKPELNKSKGLFPFSSFFSLRLKSRRAQKYGMFLCLIPIT